MNWTGVHPAVTTPFNADFTVDHDLLFRHMMWLLENGCSGLVMLGSLGEGATLEQTEKCAILRTAVRASQAKGTPVVAGVSSLSTNEAVRQAKEAEQAGCSGLMVLPPYVYASDWREMKAHVATVMGATGLPCMLYNNPIAYKTDFTPANMADLAADVENFVAVKESSSDARRAMAIREVVGNRLHISVGVDDIIVEAIAGGTRGWVAGLVNAFPRESVELYDLALAGKFKELFELYKWFLPLLRMDTVVKFVQLIKWVQEQMGCGSARVRPPRLELAGTDLKEAQQTLRRALATRPAVRSTDFQVPQEA
ncbi:MAG TPA: dihydrodipicolinate synthase family protein [Terriglobales bacterium]|nr:dihydrodipicolinate synthase family protein [Terriglobales bacterium]